MTAGAEPDELRRATLRYLLNQWDPLAVADIVADEYDCLLLPLWARLTQGATRESIAEYLRHEIQDHFGLDQERCGVDAVADELFAWAASCD
jgi:hypothetical protein